MRSEKTEWFRGAGCLAARWGCLAPLAILIVLLIRPGTAAVLLGAPFLIYLLLRLLRVALVQASMMREAGKVRCVAPPVPVSPGPPPDRPLRVLEHRETMDLSLTPWQAELVRQTAETGRGAWLSRRLRDLGDHPLLILRVFGSDANAAFVFGEIVRRWRFLGSVATIADPSYVRFQGSLAARENRRYLGLFILTYVAWASLVAFLAGLLLEVWFSARISAIAESLGWQGRLELAGIATCAALVPLLLVLALVRVRRGFTLTLKRLQQGLAGSSQTVTAGGVFHRFVLYCYDDTWKSAVSALLPASQAVLMDLRGFTPERRGCEYELGLLVDRFPIDQAVLLIDDGPNKDLLFSVLQDRWSCMSVDSPNRALQDPVLKTYVPGEEDPADITRILALLTSALPGGLTTRSDTVPAEAQVIRGETRPPAHKPGWGELFGRLDLAVSVPAVARVLIPLILAVMLFYAYWEIRPVVAAYQAFASPRIQPVAALAERGSPTVKQRILVDRLDALLPGPGWVRLSHPSLDALGRVELVRFSADDGIEVRQYGDPKRLQIHLFAADGEKIDRLSLSTNGYQRQTLRVEDIAASARVEILLGDGFFDRFKDMEFEDQFSLDALTETLSKLSRPQEGHRAPGRGE